MFMLIDNYDSFVYNLRHFICELGADVAVKRNDEITVDEVINGGYEGIILSPGPCTPNEAGICLDVVRQAPDTLPIFGVCLGHQTIGQAFGGVIERAPEPLHGKLSVVSTDQTGVFTNLPDQFEATRYHSLVINSQSLPNSLIANARAEDGCIMGVMHTDRPIHAVQFHPESIASEYGHQLLGNFLKMATNGRLPNKDPKPLPVRRKYAMDGA
jgi:anthranilate synthase/aminodeoxychorismate synthase-like glutamine amidotransferase